MTAKEIRESVRPGGRFEKVMYRGSIGPIADLLTEIAAQLAELNECIRSIPKRNEP